MLLRDIIYAVTDRGSTPRRRKGGKRRSGGEDISHVGLKTTDVQELLAALESRGMSAEEGETPGAQFILQLYEKLQTGETLRQASGHRGTSLRQADTVRTFTASGKSSQI